MASEMAMLREYVLQEGNFGQNQSEATVLLHVTHSNLKAEFLEIRLDKHSSVDDLKGKLSFHCGTSPSAMTLQLKNPQGGILAVLDDPGKKLGFYSPNNGDILHIIDLDPTSASANGWLEDVSKVEKYVMSDEEYNKRENTYRRYKDSKLADDPSWTIEREMAERRGVPYTAQRAPEKITDPQHMEEQAGHIAVGSRCQVSPGGKRGEVKYVGKVAGLPLGYWVGVCYDEPVGKNDGSVKGKQYFQCSMNYGGFIRPNMIQTGDFPELDLLESDDEL